MKRIIVFSMTVIMLLLSLNVRSDDDEHKWKRWFSAVASDIRPVSNQLYKQECGSCHMAYQAGLLPAASWQKMMSGLEDHFGENAELNAEDVKTILDYLQQEAADKSSFGRSAAFARNSGEVNLRITEGRYFIRKHDEIPDRFIKHEKIGSWSNCIACHVSADKGVYDEHDVRIPGVGRWDD